MVVARLKYPEAAKLVRREATPDSSKVRIPHGAAQGSWLAELRLSRSVRSWPNSRARIQERSMFLRPPRWASGRSRFLARLWISEGITFGFRKCPGLYEEVRDSLTKGLELDAKQISVVGSGRGAPQGGPRESATPSRAEL